MGGCLLRKGDPPSIHKNRPKDTLGFGAQIGSPDRKELSEEGDEVGAVGRTAGPSDLPSCRHFLY